VTCEFHQVIDLNRSRASGEGSIPYESMINGVSYFAGMEVTQQRSVCGTITRFEEG